MSRPYNQVSYPGPWGLEQTCCGAQCGMRREPAKTSICSTGKFPGDTATMFIPQYSERKAAESALSDSKVIQFSLKQEIDFDLEVVMQKFLSRCDSVYES